MKKLVAIALLYLTSSAVFAAEVVLELGSNDAMQFDKNEFRVPAGSTVTLNLTHTGSLAANVMGHNFVLLKPGTDIQTFGLAAVNAAANGYIPTPDDVIANTEIIGGGESTSITFEAPAAGTYDFICSFPGHFAIMKGKFRKT